MTVSGRWERRHAAEFAAASDPDAVRSDPDPEVARLVRVAETLRGAGAESPRPEFVKGLRTRLMTEAASMSGVTASPSGVDALAGNQLDPAPCRRRRLGVVAAAFAVSGATVGVGVMSAQALPGDVLYPVKRGVENARVALEHNSSEAGSSRLDLADKRLAEVRALMVEGAGLKTGTVTSQALDDFSAQVQQGGDSLLESYADGGNESALKALESFTQASSEGLAALRLEIPDSARKSYEAAVAALQALKDRVQDVCLGCASPPPILPRSSGVSAGLGDFPDSSRTTPTRPQEDKDGTPPDKESTPQKGDEGSGGRPTSDGPQLPKQPGGADVPDVPDVPDLVGEVTGLVKELADSLVDGLRGPERSQEGEREGEREGSPEGSREGE